MNHDGHHRLAEIGMGHTDHRGLVDSIDLVEDRYPGCFGTTSGFDWPVSAEDADLTAEHFFAEVLPHSQLLECVRTATSGFEGLFQVEFDGCDPVESYREIQRAVNYCREGRGPALCHAHVVRPYSHSMSDDERNYKTDAEREDEARRDPINSFAKFLVSEEILTDGGLEELKAKVDAEVRAAVDEALAMPTPHPDTALDYIYSPDVDPTSDDFSTSNNYNNPNDYYNYKYDDFSEANGSF